VEIDWDEESLAHLLYRRILENASYLEMIASESKRELVQPPQSSPPLQDTDQGQIFTVLFPEQVDPGKRKPQTWTWMMSRIRDGNYVRPPRNLIDLVQKAQEAQIRREERERNEFSGEKSLISPEAMKAGLAALSKQRVEDTLLAEAGSYAEVIERFRNGKAEHNSESLIQLLHSTDGLLQEARVIKTRDMIQILRDIGFLEPVGSNFKVPMLYREGLSITQGKAFGAEQFAEENVE
jgi:hypothetical protein